MCVGCGRCIDRCPEYISIAATVKKMANAIDEIVAEENKQGEVDEEMNNIVKPVACKILEVKRESLHEYTFKVATDIKPEHGQFLQLSIPKVGEAPISVSSFGDGWMDFTIRSAVSYTHLTLPTT